MRIALSSFLTLAVITSAAPSFAQNANPLPAGDGRDIVSVACSQCHYLGTIAKIRDGAVGWRFYVNNMVLRGAQLTPREADTVVQYLVTNFGPTAPAASSSAALATGPGKELVEARCVVCHDLGRVTAVKREKRDWDTIVANMYDRWGQSAPDEVQTITAYLNAQFGRN
jgi:cytochrome c5